jgi:hypothetical protein
MNSIGKTFIIFGVVLIAVGLLITLSGKISWLGRLPGDICIQKKNFTFYFPVTTSILISIALSLAAYLFFRR